jgi:hypothetical protein
MNELPETENPFKGLEPIKDSPVAPATGIAALALNMALKYHDMNLVKDGTLYQQYKLEGRNMRDLHLDAVFETAIQMEAFLLGASERIATLVVDAISISVTDDENGSGDGNAINAGDN